MYRNRPQSGIKEKIDLDYLSLKVNNKLHNTTKKKTYKRIIIKIKIVFNYECKCFTRIKILQLKMK